jgi:hypothetical protein
LFEEIQNMNNICLSWFNEYLSAILQALRKKAHIAVLGDGKEVFTFNPVFSNIFLVVFYFYKITINQQFGVFSTLNPFKTSSYTIPVQIRSMFRVVCLLEPDIEQIIWAKCTHYGIKCGHILASRIKTLHEICQATFTSFETKNHLTISNFLDVIRSIYERQRPDRNDSRPETSVSSANPLANKYMTAKSERMCKFKHSKFKVYNPGFTFKY